MNQVAAELLSSSASCTPGPHRIAAHKEAAEPKAASDGGKSGSLPGALPRPPSRGSRIGRPSNAALMESLAVVPPVARLLLLTPRSEALQGIIPEEISLARPRLLVGRPSHSVAVDVPLSVLSGGSDIISRRHAELQRTLDGKHIVRDAGALNGVFVNGRRIDTHVLNDGDVVQFGGVCNAPVGSVVKTAALCVQYTFRDAVCTYSHSPPTPSVPRDADDAALADADDREQASSSAPAAVADIGAASSAPAAERSGHRRGAGNSSSIRAATTTEESCASQAGIGKAVVASPSPGAALAREHQSYMKQLARSLREQLAASVACPLCSELLLDAVVCPCSHSFCWVCLEDFHRSRGLTVASCPVCVRSRPQAAHPDSDGSLLASTGDGHENIDGVGAGAGVAQYFRCAALDGLVGALLDMEGEEEGEAAREAFRSRERVARARLAAWGIKPDGAASAARLFLALARRAAMPPRTRRKQRRPASNGLGEAPSSAVAMSRGGDARCCGYCGGEGHAESDCPHMSASERNRRRKKRRRRSLGGGAGSFSDSESTGLYTSSSCSHSGSSDDDDDDQVVGEQSALPYSDGEYSD